MVRGPERRQPHGWRSEASAEAGGVLILALLYGAWFWGIVHYPAVGSVGGFAAALGIVALGRWSRSRRHKG